MPAWRQPRQEATRASTRRPRSFGRVRPEERPIRGILSIRPLLLTTRAGVALLPSLILLHPVVRIYTRSTTFACPHVSPDGIESRKGVIGGIRRYADVLLAGISVIGVCSTVRGQLKPDLTPEIADVFLAPAAPVAAGDVTEGCAAAHRTLFELSTQPEEFLLCFARQFGSTVARPCRPPSRGNATSRARVRSFGSVRPEESPIRDVPSTTPAGYPPARGDRAKP
jgi:hypothetical protein